MSAAIRLARDSDIEAISSLVALYWEFENIPSFNRARTATLLSEFMVHPEQGHCWVAEEGGQLVGYLLAVYVFSLEHGGVMAEIDEFFVVPEKRSLKIGAALLNNATAALAQPGITHIQLQLGQGNSRGQRFYEQHGFEELSEYTLLYKSLRLE